MLKIICRVSGIGGNKIINSQVPEHALTNRNTAFWLEDGSLAGFATLSEHFVSSNAAPVK